jgi:EAL domain-containing protein (putative c-di-GMP-specific phosphodiesterase class I)
VETARQLQQLRELGCDLGQGWYFSPAVDAASVTELLLRPGRSTWPNRPGPRFWSNDTRGVG